MKQWHVAVEGQSLLLQGRDTVDLLQRISTNDVTSLPRGEAVTTILTSEKGRIVGVMSLRSASREGMFSAAVWGRKNPGVATWIMKYVIMESVEVLDQTEEMVHILCFEENEENTCIRPIADLPKFERVNTYAERLHDNAWNRLTVPRVDLQTVHEALQARHIEPMDTERFERTRITAGIPLPSNELDESINPLEAGLREYVGFRKGCYIGQEVIARLDTYRKVSRILSRVRGTGSAPLPGPLEDSTGELGYLTSAATDTSNGWIGLAYLRERAFEEGSRPIMAGKPITIVDAFGWRRAYESTNV